MNASLTFNSVVFEKSFDQEGLSKRQSTARGPSIPDRLTIRSMPYTDPETKVSGTQFQAKVDRYAVDSGSGETYITSFWITARISKHSTSTDQSTALATMKAAVADTDFMADVLNSEQ